MSKLRPIEVKELAQHHPSGCVSAGILPEACWTPKSEHLVYTPLPREGEYLAQSHTAHSGTAKAGRGVELLPSVLPSLLLTSLCLEPLQSPREGQNAGVGGEGFAYSLHTPTMVKGLSRLDPISSQS